MNRRLIQFALGFALISTLLFACVDRAAALDYILAQRDGKEHRLIGEVLVRAVDGGALMQTRDGQLWLLQPSEIVRQFEDDKPMTSITQEEAAKAVLATLPAGFKYRTTVHYVIVYDTSEHYAIWCGSILEQLYRAFTNYWTRRGIKLHDPTVPLVAVVFGNPTAYAKHAVREAGEGAEGIPAYYHLITNRITMRDPTSLTGRSVGNSRAANLGEFVRRLFANPEGAAAVTNIVHEATHQLHFNTGLSARLASCPKWVSEGIAVFFETPDLNSSARRGWAGVGDLNVVRLRDFQRYMTHRPGDSLLRLIADDGRFGGNYNLLETYAESWALTYFLSRQFPRQYAEYMKTIMAKSPCIDDTPDQRLKEFEAAFGDWQRLDQQFIRYISRLRATR